MTHLTDEDLILHHYGEDTGGSGHLAGCAECMVRYQELASTLGLITIAEPPRGDQYGLEVWQRLRHRLPERMPWWSISVGRRQLAGFATAAMLLMAAGFAAGRFWPAPPPAAPGLVSDQPADEAARRRVLLLTVADHLERSDRMLTDIVNASGGSDISVERQWAADLVAANRLYRQDALETNEVSVAVVLDELERLLLEVVHQPSPASARDLADIRQRIDSAALLFKVRVVGNELRERELAPLPAGGDSPSTPSTIG